MKRLSLVVLFCMFYTSNAIASVSENSRILTKDGMVQASRVTPGTMVLTPYGGRVVLDKHVVVERMCLLKTSNREVYLSEDQKVLVVREVNGKYKTVWEPARLINKGDIVVVMESIPPLVVPGIRDLPGRTMHIVRRIFYPEKAGVILPAYCTTEVVKEVKEIGPMRGCNIRVSVINVFFAEGLLVKEE